MRFLVEVTSIGKTEKEAFCVEAESWQRALQQTRALRDDNGPMSGFSIELLDEGCRAVDPMLRLRYEVKPAPPDMPLSERASASAAPANAPANAPAKTSVPPESNAKKSVGKTTAMMGSSGALVASIPHEPQPAIPAPPPSAPPSPALVSSQVIFKREQEATSATPMAYREYVYAVAQGTTESEAEHLVRAQLEQVRASLAAVETRKLVNLAVFDVMFQLGKAKPPVLPLVTLAWKDWRDGAEVAFPRRSSASMRAAKHAPAVDPLARTALVHASPPAAIASPPAAIASPPAAIASPPAVVASPPPAPPVAVVRAEPTKSAPPAPIVAIAPSAPPPPPPPPKPQASAPPAAPEPTKQPAPLAVLHADTQPTIETPPVSPPAVSPAPAAEPHFPSGPAPAATKLDPASSAAFRAATTTTRRRGDELIADLFEAMHDLHFVQDSVAGGDFCVALALEKIPSAAGIVHLYDINKREFVVAATRGEGTRALLLLRHSEADPLLNAAMRRRRAFIVENPATGEAAMLERFTKLGGAKSLMIAPVMLSGRFLGAIELLNPLDGAPYTNDEVNALQYIAEQLAEYVAANGVVTDPDRISMPPPGHGPAVSPSAPPRRAR